MRKTFIDTLTNLSRTNKSIMCVIGDTGYSVFEDYEKEFKDRFVNVGIAEQNFVGFGAGLAAMGMKPYLYNVVSFMVYRAYEQIELDIAYQENPVVLVGVGGGHAYATAGPTHHSYFDISLMRQLPNMTVVCPADPVEMKKIMLLSEHYDKPMYIRIGRSSDPVLYEKEPLIEIGKAVEIMEGENVVLVTTGKMLEEGLKARKILRERGINLGLASMHTVKPLDYDFIKKCVQKYDYIFTLEEHSISGGLGTAVGEVLLNFNKNVCFRKFGFPDKFAPVTGTREFLNQLYGLDGISVAESIQKIIFEHE